MLKIGFARRIITPPVGSEMPGLLAKRHSTGVHDDLYASVMFLDDGRERLALVGVDALSVRRATVQEARREAQRFCGISPGNVMISASHTHSGGPVANAFDSEADPDYCRFIARQIASAVAEADLRKQDALLGIGVGRQEGVAFNRRFKMKDGTERTHPGKMNPDIVDVAGPVDESVGVIAATDPSNKFLGCWVNFACHCTVMGGLEYSADYPCYLARTVRGTMGDDAVVVFANGACGDVTQMDNRSPREREFGEQWARRIGTLLGAEVLKVIARMEFSSECRLAALSRTIPVPIRKVSASELKQARAVLRNAEDPKSVDALRAREAILVDRERRKNPNVEAEIQALRVGPAALVGVPAEFFCRLGLDIKSASGLDPTFVIELANGCIGYVCTPQAYAKGGYEPSLARSSKVTPAAGGKIVRTALQLLKRLK